MCIMPAVQANQMVQTWWSKTQEKMKSVIEEAKWRHHTLKLLLYTYTISSQEDRRNIAECEYNSLNALMYYPRPGWKRSVTLHLSPRSFKTICSNNTSKINKLIKYKNSQLNQLWKMILLPDENSVVISQLKMKPDVHWSHLKKRYELILCVLPQNLRLTLCLCVWGGARWMWSGSSSHWQTCRRSSLTEHIINENPSWNLVHWFLS